MSSAELTLDKAISAIISELAEKGVPKSQTINVKSYEKFSQYKARGVEDILKCFAPLFGKYGLVLEFEAEDINFLETSTVVKFKFSISKDTDPAVKRTYSIYGQGTKGNGQNRDVQNAQTYAFKQFIAQAFLISEGWEEQGDVHIDDTKPVSKPTHSTEIKVAASATKNPPMEQYNSPNNKGGMTDEQKYCSTVYHELKSAIDLKSLEEKKSIWENQFKYIVESAEFDEKYRCWCIAMLIKQEVVPKNYAPTVSNSIHIKTDEVRVAKQTNGGLSIPDISRTVYEAPFINDSIPF